jgi:hypothetical protein
MDHRFVEVIPRKEELREDTLYISLEYDTAVHLCCCGCQKEVVTPLSPTDWYLKYNGETVSLYPSIGNWDFECQSHYWIKDGKVQWAASWNEKQIEEGRKLDKQKKEDYYGDRKVNEPSIWAKITGYLSSLFR